MKNLAPKELCPKTACPKADCIEKSMGFCQYMVCFAKPISGLKRSPDITRFFAITA